MRPRPRQKTDAANRLRRILLVDADAFFVAVARLEDPEGAGKAELLIVGGAPGSRGVVCSASYAARQFGVRSAMPISRALRLCPRAMCVPVPRGACSRKSRDIARVLGRYAPIVEAASIDEWYIDLTGTEALYHNEPLAETARRIRDAVREATGLSVSIGGGTNRLVAKLAVELAKPRPGNDATGVFVVAPGDEAGFMTRFHVADLPGVGARARERLDRVGLRTIPDVLERSLDELVHRLGEREGRWLYERARGIGSAEVTGRDIPRSISREETFGADLAADDALERELLRLVTRAAADLRSQALATRTVNVKLRDKDFRTRRASLTLDEPVVADRVIFATARALLRKLRRARRVPARLLGVALTSLGSRGAPRQMALFEAEAEGESRRDRALADTIDALRARFGRDAVVPARLAAPRADARHKGPTRGRRP